MRMSKLLTAEQVAARLALHPHTVLRALNGQIKLQIPRGFKLGGRWRFRDDDVEKFLDEMSGRARETGETAPAPAVPAQGTGTVTVKVKRGPGRPRKVAAPEGGAA